MNDFKDIVEFLKMQADGLRPFAEICEEEGATDAPIYLEWNRYQTCYEDARMEYLAMM